MPQLTTCWFQLRRLRYCRDDDETGEVAAACDNYLRKAARALKQAENLYVIDGVAKRHPLWLTTREQLPRVNARRI